MRCSKRQRHQAATLIEVLAALVILGGLLTALVRGGTEMRQAWRRAEVRQAMLSDIDRQLRAWWRGEDGLPVSGGGTFGEKDRRVYWQAKASSVAPLDVVDIELVTLSFYDRPADRTDAKPLITMDLFVKTPVPIEDVPTGEAAPDDPTPGSRPRTPPEQPAQQPTAAYLRTGQAPGGDDAS